MALLAAICALVLALQEPSLPAVGAPFWVEDLGRATSLARESGRPLLVVFR